MRTLLLALAATAFMAATAGRANAEVVRPAPEFSWTDASGARKSSRAFLGRPVVLLVADSPRQWAFRSQVGQLKRTYERLAAHGVVCAAAFSRADGVIRSNIPFVTTPDGPAVAAALGAPRGFAIAIIGKDGNLDFVGNRVLPDSRIRDIIGNSFVVQTALRRP